MDKLKTLVFWLLLLATLGALLHFGHFWAIFPAFFCFWFGSALWDRLSQRRAIEDKPVTTIRGATMGDVEINGRIVGAVSKSPLTKRDSAFWYLEAKDLSVEDDNSSHEAFSNWLVQISDDTGTAWVRANDIRWHSLKDKVSQILTTTQMDQALGDVFGKNFFNVARELRENLALSTDAADVDNASVAADGPDRDPKRALQRAMRERAATMDPAKVEKANKLIGSMISVVDTVSKLNPDDWSIDEYVVPSDQYVFLSGKLVSVTSSSPCPFKDAIGPYDADRDVLENQWVQAMSKLESKEVGQRLDGSKEVLVLVPRAKDDGVIEISTGNKANELTQINKSLVIYGVLFGVCVLAVLYAIQG